MENQLQEIENEIIIKQKIICEQYGALYVPSSFDKIIGVAIETLGNRAKMPINGLRHPIESVQSTNWYIWGGEYSEVNDFFKPVHTSHLLELCPQALRYLGLPPGWRFLFDDKQYEDVWYDEGLLFSSLIP